VDVHLDPPRRAGPLSIGMPIEQALRVLRERPGYVARPSEKSVVGVCQQVARAMVEEGV
jgi:hypothetical protein